MRLNLSKEEYSEYEALEYVLTRGYSNYVERDSERHSYLSRKNTLVICGFPGIGKSYANNIYPSFTSDSDSSKYCKENFPKNYIKDIIENKITYNYIVFVSSHKEVRNSLMEQGIKYVVVYPCVSLKEEYIKRYIKRGSYNELVRIISDNWDDWIKDIEDSELNKYKLSKGEYLTDYLRKRIK